MWLIKKMIKRDDIMLCVAGIVDRFRRWIKKGDGDGLRKVTLF